MRADARHRHPRAPWSLLLLPALLAACTQSDGAAMQSMQTAEPPRHTTPAYFGRFRLDVPPGVTVGGVEASMMDVRLDETPWTTDAAGRPAPDAMEQAWAARLQAVRSTSRKPDTAASALLETRQVFRDLRLLLRYDAQFEPTLRMAEALRDGGAAALWLKAGYDPGYEQVASDDLINLAEAYTAFPPGARRPEDARHFHLQYGSIARPFEMEERVGVSLVADSLQMTGEIESGTIFKIDEETPGLIAGLQKEAERGLARALGVKITPLRSRERRVAGFNGEEVVTLLESASDSLLSLRWSYAGEPNSASRPELRIEMETPIGGVEQKLALWDFLLEHLHYFGAEVKQP